MRTRTILIGALLLASAGLAQAQDQQQQAAPQTTAAQTKATPASSFVPKYGTVDFGFRADNLDGDEARYNRFHDYRPGGFVDQFRFEKETPTTLFLAEANNVGYRDQRYFGEFRSIGKVQASFEWNQVPLFLTKETTSLYTDTGNGRLEIADGVQAVLQAAGTTTAVRDPLISAALAGAGEIDLRSRRDIAAFNMVYNVNRDVDVKFNLRNTNRSGNQVFAFGFGTSPGLNPAVEMGVPVDDRTTDVNSSIEFANTRGLLSLGYTGSWYDNSIPLVRFDNPLRATDISGGPSSGQAAWWPTNSSFAVNVNGTYKLPGHTRAGAFFSIGQWAQDEALPPMTVNSALPVAPLERATAETQADILSMVYTLNSRPIRNLWLNAKYRYYDYDNKTPHFTATNAIIGDWSVGTQIHETEPASFKRHNLDLDASFTPFNYLAFGVGYGREDGDRTYRIYESTAEDIFRVTLDSTGNEYFSVRLKYENSSRTGSGFEEHLLEEVGEQPETRHYDIANRDRSRFTTIFNVMPLPYLNLSASYGIGEDDYDETGFGLRSNDNDNWSLGFDITPNDKVAFGLSYGEETYKANQYSRTALPAPDPQFYDPTRDWWIDSDDNVKTTTFNLDLTKLLPKTDIRAWYLLSDGEATYVYGGPATTNPAVFSSVPMTQLTPLKNKLSNGRVDVMHFVRPNIGLGVTYHYEDYVVDDFSLDTDTINQLDPRNGTTGVFANTIYSGYLFRPYTAHTFWLKATYLW